MGRIRGLFAALLAGAVCAAPAFSLPGPAGDPQTVRITCTNGKVVEGDLLGYQDGKYRVLMKDGTSEEVEEARVQEIVLASAPPPPEAAPAREAAPPAALPHEDARAALERGDTEAALQKVLNALDGLRSQGEEIRSLAVRVYQGHIPRLLEKRDAPGLSEALRHFPEALPAESRKDLLGKLAERLAEQVRTAPEDPFTSVLAENVARLVEEGSLSGDIRTSLADHFAAQGRRESEAGNAAAAAALLRGALKLDPRRRAEIEGPLADAAVEAGRRRLAAGDARGALEAAREALDLRPSHELARPLLEDADFALLKAQALSSWGAEAEGILRAFLVRVRRTEHRDWAVEALARLAAQPAPDPAAQTDLARFFPVRPGAYLLYRRADGEVRQKVRIEAVTRTKEGARVRYGLQEIYRGNTITRPYELEIEKDAVLLSTGRERETLLRFPLREGDSWAWKSANQEFRRTVKALGQTVRVGAGEGERTFEGCAVVEFTSTSGPRTLTSRSTYAPGLGLVKLEFLDPGHRDFSLELVEAGNE